MARISNLDFYAILGVHPNAEDIVIRAAFKALAQRYHPDRFNGPNDEAHRRMSDLTSAYETLADPARRRKYDRRRGLAQRQARFYFKNPARDGQQQFGALAARAAARKAQRYRMAVYVLMVVVVILSGFNFHQHAAQIKELFAWNRTSSGTISVAAPSPVSTSTPEATVDSASSSAPPTSTTANVRILPIGQGSSRPITSNAVEPQTSVPQASVPPPPAARAPELVVATPTTPAPPETVKAPVPSAPETAIVAPAPAPASAETAKVPARAPALEPHKATVAATPAAPAAGAAQKDAKRPAAPPKPVIAKAVEPERPAAPPRPVVAKAVEPERAAAPPPVAADTDRCTAGVAALGLCNRNLTVQGH